jgi:GWxTD domain-containing protein
MTPLNEWVEGSVAKALGWTLVHSLWEGAVIALLLTIVLGIARSSKVRYWAGCCAMVALLVAFGATFSRLMPRGNAVAAKVAPLPASVRPPADDGAIANLRSAWNASDLLPWLAPVWIAGVLLFQLRCLASWLAAGRLRRTGVCAVPDIWIERLGQLRARLRMNKPVILLESCLAEVPVVIGHLRPLILMPVGLLAGLPVGQVEAILLHELAHIRRADYLINLMQTLVEGLLFYHPAAWWISSAIRAEREHCCDDLVVSSNVSAHEYATALATLAEHRWAVRETAMAATGGNLVKRIRRLLSQQEGPRSLVAPLMSMGILIATGTIALAAWQTTAPQPERANDAVVERLRELGARLLSERQDLSRIVPTVTVAPQTAATPPLQENLLATPKRLEKALIQLESQLVAQNAGRNGRPAQAESTPAPYRKWLNEDVAYIISDQERAEFKGLQTDAERDQFIKAFWERRDPTPGTPRNEYQEEHYRRIGYVNNRFSTTTIPGWKTDRGRIYIQYGPPDEIDSHPSGGKYERPAEQGGGATETYPFEQWRYRFIEGLGNNVIMEFVDTGRTGDYRMTMDPAEKDALLSIPPGAPALVQPLIGRGANAQAIVKVGLDRKITVSIPIPFEANQYLITGSTVSADGTTNLGNFQVLANSCKSVAKAVGCLEGNFDTPGAVALPPGSYTLTAVVKDTASSTSKTYVVNFTVN